MITIDESTVTNTTSYQRLMRIWLPLLIEKMTREWLLDLVEQEARR
jgi:hypothetical protein